MCNNDFLPDGVNLETLLDSLRQISWGAADILQAYARGETPPYGYPKSLNVEVGGEGPVSAADLAVNNWLIKGLRRDFPSAGWILLSEETAKDQLHQGEPLNTEWLWILDPLDGTKDFLQGTDEYAVHLALIRNNRPLLGIVLLPELEELWIGVKGIGTWCENRLNEKHPATFSKRDQDNELILVASRNHRDERLEKLIDCLSPGGTKAVGSVGCKIATILRGESDFYISLSGKSAPKDWDMAAPEAILNFAGGEFTHADGNQLLYNTGDIRQKGCLIASHGFNHLKLCEKALKGINLVDPGFQV